MIQMMGMTTWYYYYDYYVRSQLQPTIYESILITRDRFFNHNNPEQGNSRERDLRRGGAIITIICSGFQRHTYKVAVCFVVQSSLVSAFT